MQSDKDFRALPYIYCIDIPCSIPVYLLYTAIHPNECKDSICFSDVFVCLSVFFGLTRVGLGWERVNTQFQLHSVNLFLSHDKRCDEFVGISYLHACFCLHIVLVCWVFITWCSELFSCLLCWFIVTTDASSGFGIVRQ